MAGEVVDRQLLWLLEGELLLQWGHAQRALRMVNEALGSGDSETFWFAIDSALGAMARISKILWPTRAAPKESVERCRSFRRAFEVDEASPVLNRSVRDALEHFDERLDNWARSSAHRNLADRVIAPRTAIVGLHPDDYARHFDPETNIVSVFGDRLDLQALVDAVADLASQVDERHRVMWWDR